MNKLFALLFFFCSTASFASCLVGDEVYQKSIKSSVPVYQNCAIIENDEHAQMRLADIYLNGATGVEKNVMKGLLYLHLASDNGNAEAQTKLAKILLEMDATNQGRNMLISYINQIKLAFKNDTASSFKGDILHPYVLLTLAAEPADQKWYYPTEVKTSSKAIGLLKKYDIDDARKKELLKQGVQWKQRKMMETAKEVLSVTEYKDFESVIYPEKGQPDPFLRKQALSNLREKVKSYLD